MATINHTTTSSESTIDAARDWYMDSDAQARLMEEVARDLGVQVSEVKRAYIYYDAPSPYADDYRGAVREALVAEVRAARARYEEREKAHQQARRLELKAKRANPTPSARAQPYRAARRAAA